MEKTLTKKWGEIAGPDANGVPQGHVVRQLLAERGLEVHEKLIGIGPAIAWLLHRGWSPDETADSLRLIAGKPGRMTEGRTWRLLGTKWYGEFELVTIWDAS